MADETVTLEFIARQQDVILKEMRDEFRQMRGELGRMRDDMLIMAAMLRRFEASLDEIRLEVRGLRNWMERLDQRVRALEER